VSVLSILDAGLLLIESRTKTPIGPNMGNKGVLKDTEGNTIGVFESGAAYEGA
jgi:hypothetical protein